MSKFIDEKNVYGIGIYVCQWACMCAHMVAAAVPAVIVVEAWIIGDIKHRQPLEV